MRIKRLFVKDSASVQEYAYSEDKNASYRQQMEDNFVAEDDLTSDKVGFFSILDGHGGADVSEYCAKNLPIIFRQQYEKNSSNPKNLFERICKRVDKEVANINASQTGSTCCLVMVRRKDNRRTCYIGNLGDTRAIICTDKQIAKRVSIDHKVTNPSEEDRIKSQGGTIIKGRVAGQLALTRALGDLQLKNYGVSNIPDYEEVEIDQKILYMIIASDGLWDVCEDQQAVQLCKQCTNSKEMANKLVKYAVNNGSRDNTSVLVLKF